MENISQISIFAVPDLPRNNAKIGRRENFPFYGIYGRCARRMRSRIEVGVLKSTSGQCLFNGQANVINKVKNTNFKSKNQY